VIRFAGHSFAAFRTNVLIAYLHRLAFFVHRASRISIGLSMDPNGSRYLVHVRRAIAEDLANLRSVSGEV
jgi:hypothetical protein